MRSAVLLLALLLGGSLHAAEAGGIEGRVTFDGPLPGTTVRIRSDSFTAEKFTDADGRYTFDAVAPGDYEVTFQLDGLNTEKRIVTVAESVKDVSVEMRIDPTQVITLSCGSSPCMDALPETEWSVLACSDYELDMALIEALERGDRSAGDLLAGRFASAYTFSERHLIAGALLRRVPYDQPFWEELERHASVAVRSPQQNGDWTPEFVAWCTERRFDPEEYWYMAVKALDIAGKDARSRPLLLRALETKHNVLVYLAIVAFALQHDESALPAIDRALAELPDQAGWLARDLAYFLSEKADKIAMKYLSADDRDLYAAAREEYAAAQAGPTP